ncbi:MAG: hypothetical protein ACK56F_19705 [bacterium]
MGHLTKRVRSLFGWMSPPILKLRGFFSNKELLADAAPPLAPVLEVTTFLPLVTFFTYTSTNY